MVAERISLKRSCLKVSLTVLKRYWLSSPDLIISLHHHMRTYRKGDVFDEITSSSIAMENCRRN